MNRQLISAATNGNLGLVQALLAEGVDPNNARDHFGNTPLMWAAHNNSDNDPEAATGDHFSVVEELLDWNADPNLTGEDGQPTLMWAVRGGSLPIIKALLAAGADPNIIQVGYPNDTALDWAVSFAAERPGYIPIIKTLVKAGADPTLTNNRGEGPPVNNPFYQQAVQELAEEQGLIQLMMHRRDLPPLGIDRYLYRR